MMEERTARLHEGVIIYEINGKTAIVDIARHRKIVLDGRHLHWLGKLKEHSTVLFSDGRFFLGDVDVTLLVGRGILSMDGSDVEVQDNRFPSDLPDVKRSEPDADGAKLFGIDFSAGEIDSLSNLIEIACFVSADGSRAAKERDLFGAFRQISDSSFSFYKALSEGLWDQYLDRRILKNVIMKDLGIHELSRCSSVLDPGSFSVCLSTDHKATAEFIKKFDGETYRRKINLLIFDAHLDYTYFEHEAKTARGASCCNFLCHIEDYSFVNRIYVVGLRGIRTYPKKLSPKIETFTYRQLRDFARLIDDFDDTCPFHVSFDLDFLNPSCFGMTNYPVSGGAAFIEALELFDTLCRSRTVAGLDVVELDASVEKSARRRNDLVLVKDLILSFLGSVTSYDRDNYFNRVVALDDI